MTPIECSNSCDSSQVNLSPCWLETLSRTTSTTESLAPHQLTSESLDSLILLDEEVFGTSRTDWITTLLNQPTTQFFGLQQEGELVASLCMRTRKQDAICLDCVNGRSMETLTPLLDRGPRWHVIPATGMFCPHGLRAASLSPAKRIYRAGLLCTPIGPLVEWRKGSTGNVGLSSKVLSLAWF